MIDQLREGWDQAAREDPMFYILTSEDKRGNKWDEEEFFARGQSEIDTAMERLGPDLKSTGRALDFGCGLGRLTQALAHYFEFATGCDVSEEMIERAEVLNQHGDRVAYCVNDQTLPLVDDHFDLVYSMIVLQHMPPQMACGYVREFVRVLKPGGLMFFQLPEGPDCPHEQFPWLSMWTTSRQKVEGWLEGAGAEVLSVEPSLASGDNHQGWEYVARKAGSR